MRTISRKRFHIWWVLVAAGMVAAALWLSGCSALQPFAHVDSTGYEAGVKGTWADAADEAAAMLGKPAPAAGRNGSYKEVLK